MSKKETSWGIVILWFILFWPVGIYFLVRKINSEKQSKNQSSKLSEKKGKTILTTGIVFASLGILFILTLFSDERTNTVGETLSMILFMLAIGVPLILIGTKKINTDNMLRKYFSIISLSDDNSIKYIAKVYPKPYDEVVKDLQKLIDSKKLGNAYIDYERGVLITERFKRKEDYEKTHRETFRTVECARCGGNTNIPVGGSGKCEYCGSNLG